MRREKRGRAGVSVCSQTLLPMRACAHVHTHPCTPMQGLNVSLYWKNSDPRKYVNVVPTSGITGKQSFYRVFGLFLGERMEKGDGGGRGGYEA